MRVIGAKKRTLSSSNCRKENESLRSMRRFVFSIFIIVLVADNINKRIVV